MENTDQPPELPKPPTPNEGVTGSTSTTTSPSQQVDQQSLRAETITEPLTFSIILNALLKRPLDLIHTIKKSQELPWFPLSAISVICLLIFGIVVGSFSGAEQFWAAPLKIISGLGFAALICLPSLYIFSCLSGIDVSFRTVSALLISAISLLSLLLVGFAPVVWLFSTSSDSIVFFGFLCTALWLVCLAFGLKLISRSARYLGVTSTNHLKIWMAIFTLVTLQLPTTLRPIVGESTSFLNFSEKKFFLTHWLDQMGKNDSPTNRSLDH